MPDLDIVGKSVSFHFANAFRLIRGRQDDVAVAAAVRRGLAKHALSGGLPGLKERARIAAGIGAGAYGQAVIQSQQMVISDGGSRNAHIVHRALTRLLIDGNRPTNVAEAELLIARYAVELLLEHRLLSGARVDADVGMTYDEFAAFEGRLHQLITADVESVARQLVQDPTGQSVRVPPTPKAQRRRVPSTGDVLAQEV